MSSKAVGITRAVVHSIGSFGATSRPAARTPDLHLGTAKTPVWLEPNGDGFTATIGNLGTKVSLGPGQSYSQTLSLNGARQSVAVDGNRLTVNGESVDVSSLQGKIAIRPATTEPPASTPVSPKAHEALSEGTVRGEAAKMRSTAGLSALDKLQLGNFARTLEQLRKASWDDATSAEILAELLEEVGYIKNPTVAKATIQDLIGAGSPEAAVKRLFEENKGGVIFIGEMHKLMLTTEGQRAFKAMIPYLASSTYADTVVIGAGNRDALRELIRDVDPGAERRFREVPYVDFTREQLAAILDQKLPARGFTVDDKGREAALAFLEHRKRVTKNFGNGGEVDNAIDHARQAYTRRIADLPDAEVTAAMLKRL